ncbi:TetR/AcrR family transcriptional regulator [Cronobacter sakazakii]|uniref:TetR/AcrR family transcriptional regulator n=1 Tax=Cronobacter sakazakii TaxID=28141 RepID=UPI0015586689|nr:TetR/AcrR family transcriptional regulator [Cronobacter sakazakii]ELY2788434.1 TetR/AcrR family transcriptional regulator [Cronobacter sakazakii]EMA8632501.1 TetR/AcrR family transcriptional regulator [Cronobacter sakazakii]
MAGIKKFDENEALDQALDLFWRRGFSATSMPELAQVTGVQRGSLYHAYGDKQAFFLKVFSRYRERLLKGAREALNNAEPDVALRQFLGFSIANMLETGDDNLPRGCLTTKIAIDEMAMDEPIRTALRELLDTLHQLLERRLSMPDAQKRLKIPVPEAAALVVTVTRGMVVMERVYRNPGLLEVTADNLTKLILAEKFP